MKTVGFIKEHDKVKGAIPFAEFLTNRRFPERVISSLSAYLKKGTLIAGWMSHLRALDDIEEVIPSGSGYFSDGYYIWPGYLVYYLGKYQTARLDAGFLEYVLDNEHQEMNILSSKEINMLDLELSKFFNETG